jgi:hypothetical protein
MTLLRHRDTDHAKLASTDVNQDCLLRRNLQYREEIANS